MKYVERERKKGLMICAREIGFFLSVIELYFHKKKKIICVKLIKLINELKILIRI